MEKSSKHWDLAAASATRAVQLEAVPNIKSAQLKQSGPRDFIMRYVFFEQPSEDDLEALSLIETEMVSDIWGWVAEFGYEWHVVNGEPDHLEDGSVFTVYSAVK